MVPPGQYQVSASLAGFQPVKESNVPVSLGKIANIDITMQSGFGETIEVTSESLLIDTHELEGGRQHHRRVHLEHADEPAVPDGDVYSAGRG